MDANSGSMEPSIVQALDGITKALDTKVTTVLDAIKEQTSQLQAVTVWVGEAEKQIADVDDMLEHINDLDNRGHRCNIRVTGLPKGS